MGCYVRQLIIDEVITVYFMSSGHNWTDHLTKRSTMDLILTTSEGMGLESINESPMCTSQI